MYFGYLVKNDDTEDDEELSKKRQKFHGLCLPDEEPKSVSVKSINYTIIGVLNANYYVFYIIQVLSMQK